MLSQWILFFRVTRAVLSPRNLSFLLSHSNLQVRHQLDRVQLLLRLRLSSGVALRGLWNHTLLGGFLLFLICFLFFNYMIIVFLIVIVQRDIAVLSDIIRLHWVLSWVKHDYLLFALEIFQQGSWIPGCRNFIFKQFMRNYSLHQRSQHHTPRISICIIVVAIDPRVLNF